MNNCSHIHNLLIESESKKLSNIRISILPTFQTLKTNQTNIQVQSKSTYDQFYFHNKILNQYPNLYREYSNKNFDYYGITNEISYPLCKLSHNDEEIEGRYKVRFYFIKYEQHEIKIIA